MYLMYRFLNSVIFMLINLTIAMYTCRRFFKVMKSHYKLVTEISHFNAIVRQSRFSLDYVNGQVSEAMKEIEGDIGKELYVTHNLTKISSKMAVVLKRFNALEAGVIQLIRLDPNVESVKVETPSDINTEVKKILTAAKKKESQQTTEQPKTPKRSKISTTTFDGSKDHHPPTPKIPVSKFSAKTSTRAQSNSPEAPKAHSRKSSKTSPPIVQLLSERRHDVVAKPIGFRPSWKCEAS